MSTTPRSIADKLARFAYADESPSRRRATRRDDDETAGPSTPTRTTLTRKRRSSPVETPIQGDIDATMGSPVQARQRIDMAGKASPSKAAKKPRPFAGPEVYAHLRPVNDHLKPDLDIIFCGINPGRKSSTSGHHFAHPTNKFWRALYSSGITDRPVTPQEDHLMPDMFNFGLTNLCDRPTAEQSELSTLEMRLNVHHLTVKILAHRPKVVCFVGKKIWDVYESVVNRSAGPFAPVISTPAKLEPFGQVEMSTSSVKAEDSVVKLELDDTPYQSAPELHAVASLNSADRKLAIATPTTPLKQARSPTASPAKRSALIDWTQPRGFRLPHESGYTYFWVTPNTSGLERTPLADQIQIFTRLREFTEVVKSEQVTGMYRSIDVEGVASTVESIRADALARGKM